MNTTKKMLVIDVETAGGFGNPLVYDFGYKVTDRKGTNYEEGSYMINDVIRNYEYMSTAYYGEKLPQYWEDYQQGKRDIITVEVMAMLIDELIARYDIEAICAYNAKFDVNAIINTLSNFGYNYNPFGMTPIYDIWGMACETLGLQKRYFKDVDKQNWLSECGNPKTSAEVMWRYISRMFDFEEDHTGREDVEIEVQIMVKCFATHKKMTKYIINNPWMIVRSAYNDYKM